MPRVVLTFLAILSLALVLVPTKTRADFDSAPVTLVGTTSDNAPVRIIWTGQGGDIRTNHKGGAYEELWFSGKAAVWRGLAGDTHRLADLGTLQMIRILLTNQYKRVPILDSKAGVFETRGYADGRLAQLDITFDKAGMIRTAGSNNTLTFHDLKFDGNAAVRWSAYLLNPSPLQAPFVREFRGKKFLKKEPLPGEPHSLWNRPPYSEMDITGSVQLQPVNVFVGTNIEGLQVSQLLVDKMHLRVSSEGNVELRNVVIAGTFVSRTFARVSPDSRHDLVAGITLFPNSAIVINRDGHARLSKIGCSTGQDFGTSGKLDIGHGSSTTSIDSDFDGPMVASTGSPTLSHGRSDPGDRTIPLRSLPGDHLIIDTGKSLICL